MTTVPTELLRTLVAVVELRSFTKAAQSLGVTQPAVSAQIKRLQILLGSDLFDRSAPGVTLTERGELIVNYARRLLAINDRILHLAVPRSTDPPLRIGVPSDFAGSTLPAIIASFHARYPSLRYQVRGDTSEILLRDLHQGHLDLAIALSTNQPLDAHHHWREELVWARAEALRYDAGGPVPLVTLGEGTVAHRLSTSALTLAGCDYDVVYTTFSQSAVLAAVAAGLGVAMLAARSVPPEFRVKDDGFLHKPSEMWCGIYMREGIDREVIEELADSMAEVLRPRPEVAWSATASVSLPQPTVALRAAGCS